MAKLHDEPSRGILMKGRGFLWQNVYFVSMKSVSMKFDEGYTASVLSGYDEEP